MRFTVLVGLAVLMTMACNKDQPAQPQVPTATLAGEAAVAGGASAQNRTPIPEKLRGKWYKKNGTGESDSNNATMTVTSSKIMVTNCYNYERTCNVTIRINGVEVDDPLYTITSSTNKAFNVSMDEASMDIADHKHWTGTWTRANPQAANDSNKAESPRAIRAQPAAMPAAAEPAAPAGGGMKRATVTVKIQKTKADGRAWDAFGGEPDIAICVEGDSGTKCYPDGDSEMGILEPECRDAFRCTFRGVMVPSGEFEISVMDVDLAANDSIGSANCKKGKTCTAGQAKVTIR